MENDILRKMRPLESEAPLDNEEGRLQSVFNSKKGGGAFSSSVGTLRGLVTVTVCLTAVVGGGVYVYMNDSGNSSHSAIQTDCTPRIRHENRIFRQYGYVNADKLVLKPAGEVEVSECSDLERPAKGSWFPQEARTTAAMYIKDFDSDQTLIVKRGGGVAEVYLAEAIPRSTRKQLFEEIESASKGE